MKSHPGQLVLFVFKVLGNFLLEPWPTFIANFFLTTFCKRVIKSSYSLGAPVQPHGHCLSPPILGGAVQGADLFLSCR